MSNCGDPTHDCERDGASCKDWAEAKKGGK